MAPNTRQHSLTESPLLLSASAKTASQNAHMRTRQHSLRKPIASSSTHMRPRQHSLTDSPIQTGTNSRRAHMQCCLFLHNSRQHSLTESPLLLPASAGTASQKAEHSLTESPIQRGRSSQKGHMQCRVQSCLGPVEGNGPRRLCRSPTAASGLGVHTPASTHDVTKP